MVTATARETVVQFVCARLQLLGIITTPQVPNRTGVLIVVGGAQYRVGSHRQFTLLARHLALSNIASFRFDYRGMGDGEGAMAPGVDGIEDDIRAAIDAFQNAVPSVDRVVLWGLCGAASAAALYAPKDARVAGVAMLNPWVRTAESRDRAMIKHYYVDRLKDPQTWRRLFRGEMELRNSLRDLGSIVTRVFARVARSARRTSPAAPTAGDAERALPIGSRIAKSLERFPGAVLLILSGDDLTASEFRDALAADAGLNRALTGSRVVRHDLVNANHTFASQAWRDQVADWTAQWVHATT